MAEIVKDPVFGEMKYKHRWIKKNKIHLLGADRNVNIIALAYSGESICDEQRTAYTEFKNKLNKIEDKLSEAIVQYIKDHRKEIQEHYDNLDSPGEAIALVKPEAIMFSRDGKVVIMCNVAWDEENGIGVMVIPDLIIDLQDAFL